VTGHGFTKGETVRWRAAGSEGTGIVWAHAARDEGKVRLMVESHKVGTEPPYENPGFTPLIVVDPADVERIEDA
jgi:hypothetical protein